MKNYDQPAFPVLECGADGLELSNSGMTLRDYFAAQAMPKLIGNEELITYREVARVAYIVADLMLAERERVQDTLAQQEALDAPED